MILCSSVNVQVVNLSWKCGSLAKAIKNNNVPRMLCTDWLPPLRDLRGLAALADAQAHHAQPPPAAFLSINGSCGVAVGVQGALAALQVGETSRAAEATFIGVTHSLSVTACAARVRRDVAQGSAEVRVPVRTARVEREIRESKRE